MKIAIPNDLLEVYNESELRKLKQRGAINFENITHKSIVTENDEIEFDTSDKNNVNIEQQLANLDIDVGQQPNKTMMIHFQVMKVMKILILMIFNPIIKSR